METKKTHENLLTFIASFLHSTWKRVHVELLALLENASEEDKKRLEVFLTLKYENLSIEKKERYKMAASNLLKSLSGYGYEHSISEDETAAMMFLFYQDCWRGVLKTRDDEEFKKLLSERLLQSFVDVSDETKAMYRKKAGQLAGE